MTKTVAYNAIGNITAKSDVGTYTYDPTRVHAVASITGVVTASYSYDTNGNMLTGRGRTGGIGVRVDLLIILNVA